ncbi:thiolase family protein [Mycoplasma sp. P36-A1]|uniref:thiolase family protein n=1 Tax=Mycoplasma sp. P36-A1 TaxID=3252900 RepID=UPI003C30C78E
MNVYIIDSKRTAIGSLDKSLSKVPVSELGATVVKTLVEDNKIDSNDINEVITGNVLPALAGQGVGRQVAIKAGLDQKIPGYSVNMVCGSGIKSIANAYTAIKAEEAEMIIAGGSENMSMSPYAIPNARQGLRLGDAVAKDTLVFDALTDAYSGVHMGVTAENIARLHSISREAQDEFSYNSTLKAINAIDNGYFKEEIVPVTIKNRKGDIVFDTDEHPNRTSDLAKLGKLRAVFEKDGTVTAGNASGINDGAAYSIIASEKMVEKYGFKPMAKILAVGQAAIDPQYMGLGPVHAIENLLTKTDIKFEDIEIFELNEAFAAQSLGVVTELVEKYNTPKEELLAKINVCGGAIALGHPVGASGARIVTTLLHQMKRLNKKYGLASLCIGGGMGIAILVENID